MSRRRTHSVGVISEHQRAVVRLRATGPQHPEGRRRHHPNRHRSLRHPQTDEELALHLAMEELRAFDTRQQDRALALRLQEQDRSVVLLSSWNASLLGVGLLTCFALSGDADLTSLAFRNFLRISSPHPLLGMSKKTLYSTSPGCILTNVNLMSYSPEQAGLNPVDVLRTFFKMVYRLNVNILQPLTARPSRRQSSTSPRCGLHGNL